MKPRSEAVHLFLQDVWCVSRTPPRLSKKGSLGGRFAVFLAKFLDSHFSLSILLPKTV